VRKRISNIFAFAVPSVGHFKNSQPKGEKGGMLKKRIVITALLVVFCLSLTLPINAKPSNSGPANYCFDILIINGSVIDGTGAPRFSADIGIKNGKIVAIGDLQRAEAEEIIDATGLIVCPGFIDPHTHADRAIAIRPQAMNYIRQGITLVLGGMCGGSKLKIGEFLDSLDALEPGIAINFATLIGQGSIRTAVMGSSYESPTPEELDEMKGLVAKGMQEGAFGLSTGLEYYPGLACSTEEIIELAKVAGQYGGVYTSHVRCEYGYGVVDAHAEAIEIGEEAGIPVQISHIKIDGIAWWGDSDEDIAMINEARARGVDVTCDQYPYDGWSSGMDVFLPVWAWEPFEGKSGWEAVLARLANSAQRALILEDLAEIMGLEVGTEFSRIIIASCDWNPALTGKTLAEVMDDWGLPQTSEGAAEAAARVIENGSCSVVCRSMGDYDIENFMRQPFQMFGSDSSVVAFGAGKPHPRNYGAFPRILRFYVREKGILTLEEAIHKMTYMAAEKFGFLELGRGLIKKGFWADIVVFNPETVVDKATFFDPHQYAEGFEAVLVNGKIALRQDEFQDVYAGQVLRHTPLAIKACIEQLPSEVFAPTVLQKPLAIKAEVVMKMIEAGEYCCAINMLVHDLRPKMDGFGKDWVVDPEARENLCALIDNTVHWLEMQL